MKKNRQKQILSKFKKLNSKFIFMLPGFNMRNNEIGAFNSDK